MSVQILASLLILGTHQLCEWPDSRFPSDFGHSSPLWVSRFSLPFWFWALISFISDQILASLLILGTHQLCNYILQEDWLTTLSYWTFILPCHTTWANSGNINTLYLTLSTYTIQLWEHKYRQASKCKSYKCLFLNYSNLQNYVTQIITGILNCPQAALEYWRTSVIPQIPI